MRPAAAVLVLLLTAASSGAQGPDPKPVTGATVVAIQSWVQAVRTHTPGRPDDPVATVAALSYEAREELNAGMGLFLRALLARTYNTRGNAAAKEIVGIGHAAGNPSASAFLKQAAVLHADVAVHADRFPVASALPERPRSDREPRIGAGRGTILRDERIPPLLTANRLVLSQDGQVVGEAVASWNWPFARSLLDLVGAGRGERGVQSTPAPAGDPFVGAWYHATTAYMFASALYGEATPHLQHAAGVLPDDARVLFDRGCYAEILGLPMLQALLSERDVVDQRSRHTGGPTWVTPKSAASFDLPSAEKTNAEAERLFRRALAEDPSLVEPRVRLARLLDLRSRHKEAAGELRTALASNPSGVVAYYAHLFAGRAAQAMGQTSEALPHYQAALALFPDAQSALLASSHLALIGADVAATLAPVDRLGERSEVFTADPWWQYHLCSGRDADDLLASLWASVPR